jgi:hypothetical protein
MTFREPEATRATKSMKLSEEALPTKDGHVVCAAITRDANPEAPMIILPGFGPEIQKSAEIFASQQFGIPIFMKQNPKEWLYVGFFCVKRPRKIRPRSHV